ncbi:MAG TPA: phage baseplate assembly protein V, partial [Acetobacteraceae bacterium]|nr:phage baseplate assembly protein V [Acetobacteraceae bacterium]
CLPMTGIQAGVFTVPPIGAAVWIEFEQGNTDYPIWTGGFWGSAAEVPALALATPPALQAIVLQTVGQNTLMISDTPGPTGGILLKTTTGAMIAINDVGITISNGQGATIVLAGPSVTINQGALAVI